MNPQYNPEEELRRREKELQAREHALRLRELEAEVNLPVLMPTEKHQEPAGKLQRWKRNVIVAAKFFGIVVATFVAVQVASVLAGVVLVGVVAWVIYKVYFEERFKRKG